MKSMKKLFFLVLFTLNFCDNRIQAMAHNVSAQDCQANSLMSTYNVLNTLNIGPAIDTQLQSIKSASAAQLQQGLQQLTTQKNQINGQIQSLQSAIAAKPIPTSGISVDITQKYQTLNNLTLMYIGTVVQIGLLQAYIDGANQKTK